MPLRKAMTGATACGEAEAVLALVLTFGAIVGASLLAKSLALVAKADGVAGKPAPTSLLKGRGGCPPGELSRGSLTATAEGDDGCHCGRR